MFVAAMAVSRDGKLLAATSHPSAITLWRLPSRVLVGTLAGHRSPVNGLDFSPNGRLLASSSPDGTVRLWDLNSLGQSRTISAHANHAYSVRFSPDGKTLVSGGDDNSVRLWDAQTGTALRILSGPSGGVHSVAFSPSGRWLAAGSGDGAVRLWDLTTSATPRIATGHSKFVLHVAYSPNGRMVGVAVRFSPPAASIPPPLSLASTHGPGPPGRAPQRLSQVRMSYPPCQGQVRFAHRLRRPLTSRLRHAILHLPLAGTNCRWPPATALSISHAGRQLLPAGNRHDATGPEACVTETPVLSVFSSFGYDLAAVVPPIRCQRDPRDRSLSDHRFRVLAWALYWCPGAANAPRVAGRQPEAGPGCRRQPCSEARSASLAAEQGFSEGEERPP